MCQVREKIGVKYASYNSVKKVHWYIHRNVISMYISIKTLSFEGILAIKTEVFGYYLDKGGEISMSLLSKLNSNAKTKAIEPREILMTLPSKASDTDILEMFRVMHGKNGMVFAIRISLSLKWIQEWKYYVWNRWFT